jgi:hypothetical protein
MKAGRLTVALCYLLLIRAAAFGQCSNDLIGVWHNELKATLTITAISANGQLTGTYQPGASEQIFPLIGWVNPVAPVTEKYQVVPVIFTVQLAPYGNIIVWSGYLSMGNDGVHSITTIWNVVHAHVDPDNYMDHIAMNAAVFKTGPAN